MADDFQYDVFLSHCSKDKPAVRELAERLKGDGLRVWFDEWVIRPGDSIPLAIEQGLESSRTLVLVMSQSAFASEWVALERHTALFRDPTNQQRRFIPLRLDDCDIKDSLKQFAYVDWRERDEQEYQRLLHGIGAETTDLMVWYGFDSTVMPIVFHQVESRRPRVKENQHKDTLAESLKRARDAYDAVVWPSDYERNTLIVTAARVAIVLASIFESAELLHAVSLGILRMWRTICREFSDKEVESLIACANQARELELCELFDRCVSGRKPLPK